MKIVLQNFRIHKYLELEFSDGKITLLKGENGVGKSTIFNAIKWCFYGELKKIYPKESDTKKIQPSVTIIFSTLTIKRSKNPELLKLEYGGKEYIDDIAQAQINNIFGDNKIWANCSYSEQEYRNILISGTESEKMELLNNLSFSGSNPEETLIKISETIKSNRFQIALCNEKHESCKNEYNAFLAEYDGKFDNNSMLSEQDYKNIINMIENEKKKLEEWKSKKIENDTNKAVYLHLSEEINVLETKIKEISLQNENFLSKELNQLEITIIDFKKYLEQYPRYMEKNVKEKELKQKLIELGEIQDPNIIYENIKQINSKIETNMNLFNSNKLLLDKYNLIVGLYNKINNITLIPDLIVLEQKLTETKKLKEAHRINDLNIISLQKVKQEIEVLSSTLAQQGNLAEIKTGLDTCNNYLQYETMYSTNLKIGEKIIELTNRLNNIENWNQYTTYNITDDEIKTLSENITIYNKNLQICTEVNLQYDSNLISNEIVKINKLISDYPSMEKKKKILSLLHDLNEYKEYNVTEEQIHSAQLVIYKMENSLNTLKCPHCNTNLKLEGGILKTGPAEKSSHEEIYLAKDYYKKLCEDRQKTLIKQNLESQINSLMPIPEVEVIELDLNSLYIKINLLQNIKYIPIPKLTNEQLNKYIFVRNIIKELEAYKSGYNPNLNGIDFSKIRESYNTLKLKYDLIIETTSKLEGLKKAESEIIIQQLPIINIDIEVLEQEFSNYKLLSSQKEQYYNEMKLVNSDNYTIDSLNSLINELNSKNIIISNETNNLRGEFSKLNNNYNENSAKYSLKTEIVKQIAVLESEKYDFNLNLQNVTESSLQELITKKDTLTKQIQKINDDKVLLTTYTCSINEIKLKLNNIIIDHTLDSNILNLEKNILTLIDKINKANIYNKFIELYMKFSQIANTLAQLEARQTGLHQLETIAKETERYCLDNTVDAINERLDYICRNIFENEFNIKLSLYKTLKNGTNKSAVTVDIFKNAVIYSIDELSPGQRDKISIAFMVTLSHYTNSPILMLDECMASLSEENREKCFRCIKENTNKTTLIISHLDVEGYYDNVIQIGCC